MQKYINNVQNTNGDAISGVTVTVRTNPGGVLATIFSDNGVTGKTNPFTNDSDGEFFFYAANGRYDVEFTVAITDSITDVLLYDPAAGSTGVPDGTLDGDMLYWDQTGTQAYLATSNLSWNETSKRLTIGANGFYIQDLVSGTGLYNTANVLMLDFNVANAILMEYPEFRIQAGNFFDIHGTGGSRARMSVSAAGQLTFGFDSSRPLGADFEYPLNVRNEQPAPLWIAGRSQIYSVGLTSASAATMVQEFTSRNFPISNQLGRVWRFNNPTAAADPGANFMRANTNDLSTVTALYLDDEDYPEDDTHWWFTMLNVGDILELHQPDNDARWGHYEITSITDNTGWWTIGVVALAQGATGASTVWLNGQAVQIEVQRQSLTRALYNATQENLRASAEAGADIGMGAEVRHNDDVFYPVGMNVVPEEDNIDTGNETLALDLIGKMIHYNSATARSLFFNNDANIPVNALFALKVGPSAGVLTGDGGTGVLIRWWNGTGWTTTAAAGNITIGVGDYTIWKETDTLFHISGPTLS